MQPSKDWARFEQFRTDVIQCMRTQCGSSLWCCSNNTGSLMFKDGLIINLGLNLLAPCISICLLILKLQQGKFSEEICLEFQINPGSNVASLTI